MPSPENVQHPAGTPGARGRTAWLARPLPSSLWQTDLPLRQGEGTSCLDADLHARRQKEGLQEIEWVRGEIGRQSAGGLSRQRFLGHTRLRRD